MNSWDLCVLLKSKGVLVSHFPMSTSGPSIVTSHDNLSHSPPIPHGSLRREAHAKSNRVLIECRPNRRTVTSSGSLLLS